MQNQQDTGGAAEESPRRSKENGPSRGHFRYASVFVTTMLDDDDIPVVMVAPSMIAMHLGTIAMHLGARAKVMMVAALDHDGLSACNRRCCDGDRAKRRNNVSKLIHVVLLG